MVRHYSNDEDVGFIDYLVGGRSRGSATHTPQTGDISLPPAINNGRPRVLTAIQVKFLHDTVDSSLVLISLTASASPCASPCLRLHPSPPRHGAQDSSQVPTASTSLYASPWPPSLPFTTWGSPPPHHCAQHLSRCHLRRYHHNAGYESPSTRQNFAARPLRRQ
ncbi:hypothetical protein EDB86DRAFT_3239300 [Lactarius hatsudake]|nr:hypothetical protein EDB86DRAFT_3239300 [Lactarius hatsudake]